MIFGGEKVSDRYGANFSNAICVVNSHEYMYFVYMLTTEVDNWRQLQNTFISVRISYILHYNLYMHQILQSLTLFTSDLRLLWGVIRMRSFSRYVAMPCYMHGKLYMCQIFLLIPFM